VGSEHGGKPARCGKSTGPGGGWVFTVRGLEVRRRGGLEAGDVAKVPRPPRPHNRSDILQSA
jgi:hypothetical protein